MLYRKLLFVFLLIVTTTCKESDQITPTPDQGENQLNENTFVLDTLGIKQVESEFVVLFKNKAPVDLSVGSIVISNPTIENPYGLLRKITSINDTGTELQLTTEVAALNEAFAELHIDEVVEESSLTDATEGGRIASDLINIDLSSVVDYEDFSCTGTLTVGASTSSIKYVKTKDSFLPKEATIAAKLTMEGNLEITNEKDLAIELQKKVLKVIKLKPMIVPIPVVVPLVGAIVIRIPFQRKFEISCLPFTISGKAALDVEFKGSVTLGAKFENNEWTKVYEPSHDFKMKDLVQADFNPSLSLDADLTLLEASYLIMPFDGSNLAARFSIPYKIEFSTQLINQPNWTLTTSVLLEAELASKIFGMQSNFSFSVNAWEYETSGNWSLQPKKVELAGGSGQVGESHVKLPSPFKVMLLDIHDNPVNRYVVNWSVLKGDGVLDSATTRSNSEGTATVFYTPGTLSDTEEIVATVRTKEGFNVEGSPVKFIVDRSSDVLKDIDGNQYTVVKIGDQYWMRENLLTTKYNDGTNIVTGLDADGWYEAFNNPTPFGAFRSSDDATLGKLYNWPVVGSGKLCPQGWHIPTRAEFLVLINHLGGHEVAGGKMKAVSSLWTPSNVGATNTSNFTALPAGLIDNHGYSGAKGETATFWTSTTSSSNSSWAYSFSLFNSTLAVDESEGIKTPGRSCRCIKN